MGVRFDRVLDGFDGPFQKLTSEVKPPSGRITSVPNPAGYLLSHEVNDSFTAVNRLLHDSEDVQWLKNSFTVNGKNYPAGTQYISSKSGTLAKLRKLADEIGLSFDGVAAKPDVGSLVLRAPRVALWDRPGGSVSSGWTRFVLEKFEFPFTVVFDDAIQAGDFSRKFDVLILSDDAPASSSSQIQSFLQQGGSVIAIGHSTRLAYTLNLPVSDALANLTRRDFYVPGSLLAGRIDNTNPLAYGMPDHADFFFDNDPVFRAGPGVSPVAWYDSASPLRSGWAWGQKNLENAAAVLEVPVGKGKLFMFGPEILFRSQPHGTYKLFFNAIYYGTPDRH
jgi:hypothetical protein